MTGYAAFLRRKIHLVTGADNREDLTASLRVYLSEAHPGRYPGFHSNFTGGIAVSSLSDTQVRRAASATDLEIPRGSDDGSGEPGERRCGGG